MWTEILPCHMGQITTNSAAIATWFFYSKQPPGKVLNFKSSLPSINRVVSCISGKFSSYIESIFKNTLFICRRGLNSRFRKLRTGNRVFTYVSAVWVDFGKNAGRRTYSYSYRRTILHIATLLSSHSPRIVIWQSNTYRQISKTLLGIALMKNYSNSVKEARNIFETI